MNKAKNAAWIILGLGLAACPRAGSAEPPPVADTFFSQLVNQARASSAAKYDPPAAPLPDFLKDLDYDAYRRIQFRPEKAAWFGMPGQFQVQFFHPGYIFREPVRIHIIEESQVHEVRFSPAMFDYGGEPFPEPVPPDLSLAGLRLLYPLNQPSKMDEVAVFLASSYFRVLGGRQTYGCSARGLAIDTAEPGGEEFPRFTEFWVERPGPLAKEIRLYARLESRRAAAAYQFLIRPGEATVVDVEASLFLREEVKKLGLAPITSMFVFGENRTRYYPDFRPEVHDSDGLLVENRRQIWQWRPLLNPAKVHQVSAFAEAVGFGLFQRDRDGDHYQDLEAHYESRPSYWVSPEGRWGAGRVELVEIPTTEERNDNIVAYWVPEHDVPPGQEFRFRYQLRALLTDIDRPPSPLFRVQSTRLQPVGNGRTRIVIDFAGGSRAGGDLAPDSQAQTVTGRLENLITQRNEMLDGWRTFFDFIPDGDPPNELRVWLQRGEQVVSETWVYHFTGE